MARIPREWIGSRSTARFQPQRSEAIPQLREWGAFAAGLAVAAVAVVFSTALSEATGLIFHLHPIAIAAAGAWTFRRLVGGRPCATRSVAFVFALATLLSAGESFLARDRLTDAPALSGAIALLGLAAAGSILLRADRHASVSRGSGG